MGQDVVNFFTDSDKDVISKDMICNLANGLNFHLTVEHISFNFTAVKHQ